MHREHPQTANGADDRQREEQSEDHMGHHQKAVDSGNTETEDDLIPPAFRRRSRIGHHVERVENESDTGHRHQRRAKRIASKQTSQCSLCNKAAEPRSDERQPVRETRVQERSRADDDSRQNPVADPGHVFRELIRRRDADPREGEQRYRDAEVRRIEEVARAASFKRSAQEALRRDRHDTRKHDWSKRLVRVKKHRAREPGDVRREQKVDELARAATEEPQRAMVETCVDELKQQLGTVSSGQRRQRLGQRLFEAKESVSQDVENSDGDRKTTQPSQTIRSIAILICTH